MVDRVLGITVPTALLMLKAPVAGEVKTRLAQEVGTSAALAAYRSLVERQLGQIPRAWRVHICYAPAGALAAMQQWLGGEHEYSAQAAGDLGDRLAAATARHFRMSTGPLIVLGGDCPYLERERLQEAARNLENATVVLVPALDGGYCLLGMRRSQPDIFRAISWSTAEVLAQTRERLSELKLVWTELAVLEDVDDYASWQRALRAYPELMERAR